LTNRRLPPLPLRKKAEGRTLIDAAKARRRTRMESRSHEGKTLRNQARAFHAPLPPFVLFVSFVVKKIGMRTSRMQWTLCSAPRH